MALKRLRWNSEKPTGFEKWGNYMDAKLQKLEQQYQTKANHEKESNSDVSKIFEGISIIVNGYTVPSAEELQRLMIQHGGKYFNYNDNNKVTHVIASNLPHVKIKRLKKEKIVKPDWITESVKAGKLLPYTSYMLYNPQMLEGQTKLSFGPSEQSLSDQTVDSDSTDPSLGLQLSEFSESDTADIRLRLSDSDDISDKKNNDSSVDSKLTAAQIATSKSEDLRIDVSDSTDNSLPNSAELRDSIVPLEINSAYSIESKTSGKKNIPKAGEENFISSYYSHSRLHHISDASNKFKEHVKLLHKNHEGNFHGRTLLGQWKVENGIPEVLLRKGKNVFMHIDMDCFFVSVALRKRKNLIGKPVAVTHASRQSKRTANPSIQKEWAIYQKRFKQKSKTSNKLDQNLEIITEEDEDDSFLGPSDDSTKGQNEFYSMAELACCSYEARQCGIRNGTVLGHALKLCPELQLVPFDFEGYDEVSKMLYEIISSCTLDIEAISCDELFLDCTDVLSTTNTAPLDFASFLRQKIETKTGCPASAGLGGNILLARLATRRAKPNGQYYVRESEENEFMKEQSVKSLPGVGHITQSRLEAIGVFTCGDLQKVSLAVLQKEFGPNSGKTLFNYCRGKDDRKIQTEKERKSVSAEINYGMRFLKAEEPEDFLKELAEEVERRLKKISRKGKHITLKIKARSKDAPTESAKYMGHGVCDNVTRSTQLYSATNSAVVIGKESVSLLRLMNLPPEDVRGMGIQVSKLEAEEEVQKNKSIFDFVKNMEKVSSVNKEKETETKIDQEEILIATSDSGSREELNIGDVPSTSTQKETDLTNTVTFNKTFSEWMPSPSQIDSSVWMELPKDIQEQLSAMYGKDSLELKNPIETPIKASSKKNALPLLSQLDMSVVDALPDDIRNEVLEAYYQSNKEVNSPAKKVIAQKKSPTSKRGRKKGSKNQIKKQLFEPVVSPVKRATEVQEEREITESGRDPRASLCGTTELEDQRKLIVEWVKYSDPVEEDKTVFLDFLTALIEEKQLEKLDLIVKCFYRTINEQNSSKWKETYTSIINDMQPVMIQNYDHVLKVSTF